MRKGGGHLHVEHPLDETLLLQRKVATSIRIMLQNRVFKDVRSGDSLFA